MKKTFWASTHLGMAILTLTASLFANRALGDSITLTEKWNDITFSTNTGYVSKDVGTLSASLTVPGLSGMTANDWSNLTVTVSIFPYKGLSLGLDSSFTMSQAPDSGGSLTTTSATFFFQDLDTSITNVEKVTFSRSGNTFTMVNQTLNPSAYQPPDSLLAVNYLGLNTPIVETNYCEISLQDNLDNQTFLSMDVIKNIYVTGADTIANGLDTVQISGAADFTPPTQTFVSPPSSINTSNGLLTLQVRAVDNVGVANVEFFWNGQDFGSGNPGVSNLWTQIFALAPGINTFQTVATDADGNGSTNSLNVTFAPPSNPNLLQFSEHWEDFSQPDGLGNTNFNFNQDVAVLNAALLVPGLQSLSAATWSNLVLTVSLGETSFSNSLANADILTPTSATFYVIDETYSVTPEQLTIARVGNTLTLFNRTGNPNFPSYVLDNTALIADQYFGTNGPIQDQQPFTLSLLDGGNQNPYASVSQPIYITGSDVTSVDSGNAELDNIQVSGTADFVSPVNQITSPISGQQWSNATFTVTGKAGDNIGVTNVLYSLNHSDWLPAESDNGWTNWSVLASLVPGTNIVAAYAIDDSGNVSPTNTVTIVYVVSATLAVSTNGVGAISPSENGALLQVGKNYALTAIPLLGSGFAFANWTGGTGLPLNALTNSPTMQFQMVSNLMLQANFVDTNKPVLKITNALAGMLVSNANFTVSGNATDNVAVASLSYQLNGGGWFNATSFDGRNWSDSVTLNPGTNQFQTYAVDTAGNVSPTNTVAIVYVVSATLTVSTNGVGAVSPNENGALLQIGKNYALTAIPRLGSGFAFTNWSGGTNLPLIVLTNKPTLQFQMITNLMLQANFVDTNKPVLKITNALTSLIVSNANFTVSGNATDNVAVASVSFQLNGGGWFDATNFDGRNWSDSVFLNPGTNRFQAYAVDTAGNVSPTNTLAIVYVVSATLTVSTNGVGAISLSENGALLQIGKNYALTAIPRLGSGFAFTNWSGGTNLPLTVLTNKPVLQFQMITNLMLQANFVDTNKPVLRITNAITGMLVSNANFTVSGSVTDNVAVASVISQLNGTGWTNSATVTGRNWSNSVTLNPGTNLFQAYAVDTAGNVSQTNTVAIVYVVSAALTVSTNGVGFISPNENGALLQIGKNYALTAIPLAGSGFAFTNWSGGTNLPLTILTNKPVLQFQMVTNLMLQANFVDTNKPVLRITNAIAGMLVSNANFTVSGSVTDNVAVASVISQLNGTGWTNSAIVTGRNWSNSVTLNPGTNLFQAYAVDTAGNVSPTNTLTIVYVVSATLTVSTNGVGFISPSENGALLQIGKNYVLTAIPLPGSGFAFTNWSGGTNLPLTVLTNKPVLVFQMATNLMLQANLVDTNRPVLKITNALISLVVSNANFTVLGTATDNVAVASVVCQLNGTGWTNSTTLAGRNWGDSILLNPGTNQFQAYAMDSAGNVSPTNALRIVYVAPASSAILLQPLQVTTANGAVMTKAGSLQIHLSGPATATVIIESSPDLIHWQPVETLVLPEGGTNRVVPVGQSPSQFIRTRMP